MDTETEGIRLLDFYLDTKTGKVEVVLDTTKTSVLVSQTKLTEQGINCSNWFYIDNFLKRFKKEK